MVNLASLYDTLGAKVDSTYEELKTSYQKLILTHHPDKSAAPDAAEKFRNILDAWRVLGDSDQRKQYDKELKMQQRTRIFGEQTLLEEFSGPDEEGVYFKECRCGGEYEISMEQMHVGFDTVQCCGCSLYVTVVKAQ